MLDPTPTTPPAPAPPPEPAAPTFAGHHAWVLRQVRGRQRRLLWLQGLALGLGAAVALGLGAALVAPSSPLAGTLLVWAGALAPLAGGALFGLFLARRRVGDDTRTARLVAQRAPELSLDLLAAVELSRALGERHDFSEGLARAFLKKVDGQAAVTDLARLVDSRGARRAFQALAGVLALATVVVFVWSARLERGWELLRTPTPEEAAKVLEPITGDVTLTYRYPAYTGLLPRTVEGTTGEVSALAGTEVKLETRADRDVDTAELVVNGQRLPLKRTGTRSLEGSFVLDAPGQYHFEFLHRGRKVAMGPEVPVRLEADTAPAVRLTAPLDEVELDPGEETLALRFDVSDDYGVSALALVFRAPGNPKEQRVKLAHDEGRSSKGQYKWDVAPLKLQPGQTIAYFLEALDNDTVKGPKKGVSRTQRVKLYSAAEHRRAAVKAVEQLWERLVVHLADRMEGPDRDTAHQTTETLKAAAGIDERGVMVAGDGLALSTKLLAEPDAPLELAEALRNASAALRTALASTSGARRVALRLRGGGPDFSVRLAAVAADEIRGTEKSVLYLEALLDRQKLLELKEQAELLRADRREMSRLLEEFQRTQDEQTRAQLLEQMERLKENIARLMERMSELSKGIRDEHLNREALQELMDEKDLSGELEEIARLVREGKVGEAMKKMQELSMQMDEMLEDLDEAAAESDEEADPELAAKYEEFKQNLDQTVQEQAKAAAQTQALRDKYKEQMKDRVAQKGEQLKTELLKATRELKKEYETLDTERYGSRFERPRGEAIAELQHLEEALKAGDFDLAAESAKALTPHAEELAYNGLQQRQLDERFANPPEVTRDSQLLAERLRADADQAGNIEDKLKKLFPNPQQLLSPEDRQQLQQLGQKQRSLEKRGGQLAEQMDDLAQRAPLFNPEAQAQMDQAVQKMGGAAEGLEGKDARRAHGEQQGALESLRGLQRQMEQGEQQGGQGGPGVRRRRGLPMPLSMGGNRRGGGGIQKEKVDIPDEDPNAAPQQLRKDVMDAMKQGAPDRYREQNKKYYEELVK